MLPTGNFCYRALRPILFRIDAERTHRWTLAVLRRLPHREPLPDPPELNTTVFGLKFSNPIGLAAGMDKNIAAAPAWNSLGFGFAELGTITPLSQPGNPPPRLWRIPKSRALINRLGFPSDGMEAAAARLKRLRRHPMRMRIAVNIGPNKETPAEHVADDYQKLVRQLGGFADFIVVNLSSPNTPGLREFQAPTRMRGVIEAIRSVSPGSHRPPLLIKIAPDLDAGMLREICAIGIDLGLDGIVATNTTLMHAESGVTTSWQGGLSGEPLKLRARSIIARIREFTGGKIAIIGVGGISSAEDAYGHIRAGANLVELYTGLVYEGPGVVGRIKQDLIRLLARDGFRSISEAVGSAGA